MRVVISAAVAVTLFAVKINAVGACVAENAVEDNFYRILFGFFYKLFKLLFCAQKRVGVFIVGCVVAVV